MAAFRVDKVYMVMHRDLIVLAGEPEGAMPLPGAQIDLPQQIKGPGWVPIADVQMVPFADGVEKLCVILDYGVVEPAPFMEFSDLEGLTLEVKLP